MGKCPLRDCLGCGHDTQWEQPRLLVLYHCGRCWRCDSDICGALFLHAASLSLAAGHSRLARAHNVSVAAGLSLAAGLSVAAGHSHLCAHKVSVAAGLSLAAGLSVAAGLSLAGHGLGCAHTVSVAAGDGLTAGHGLATCHGLGCALGVSSSHALHCVTLSVALGSGKCYAVPRRTLLRHPWRAGC